MIRFLFCLLLLAGLGAQEAFAGVAVLRPRRSPDALISAGGLDCDLLSKLVLEETNRYRASRGREPLLAFRPLMTAAQDHALAMADGQFLSHQNPKDRSQRTLTDRIKRVGLQPSAYAENIAMNFSVDFRPVIARSRKGRKTKAPDAPEQSYRSLAQCVSQQWINSRGHRENILGRSYDRIGLGFATAEDSTGCLRVYCVQTFAAAAPDPRLAVASKSFHRSVSR